MTKQTVSYKQLANRDERAIAHLAPAGAKAVCHCGRCKHKHAALVAVAELQAKWEFAKTIGHIPDMKKLRAALCVAQANLAAVSGGLCKGCYKSPCVCLPDDCNCDPT